MDDSGFPRTPDIPVKLLGTRVRYQRSVETSIGVRGLDFLGGSATEGVCSKDITDGRSYISSPRDMPLR